jgi:hypothetical protein
LLSLYAFILLGVFLGDTGVQATFEKSAPKLAARMEANISTGTGFADPNGAKAPPTWRKPNGRPQGGF